LERLVVDRPAAERRVSALRTGFFQENLTPGCTGEIKRAADRFAVIAAAGELATEWGITGWESGEVTAAAQTCFLDWLSRRGTTGPSDVEAGFRQVRAFIAANGPSRFQSLGNAAREPEGNDGGLPVRDRVGFRRRNSDSDETEYLVFPDAFKDVICKGQAQRAVLKELDKRGFLVRDGQNLTIKVRLPEGETARLHCIRGAILEGGDARQP
jgi:uncharacterized protein (DUF927 family)